MLLHPVTFSNADTFCRCKSLRQVQVDVAVQFAQLFLADGSLDAARRSSADLVLLDNGYGTGEAFDWTLVRDIGRPFALAGGLRADNLSDAAKMQPYVMDISSGAETDGVKDADKIRALIEQIRSF